MNVELGQSLDDSPGGSLSDVALVATAGAAKRSSLLVKAGPGPAPKEKK